MKPWLIILLCWIGTTQAHEVHHRVEATGAVVVSLSYADGKPFAFEKYALYPAGQDMPVQVGNTDAAGRVSFLPGTTEKWRLQATSADGHGIDLEFTTPATAASTGMAPAAPATEMPRWQLAGFGLALIFGLFGLVQLFMRNKS